LGWPSDPASIVARGERWRPWRAYATQHLWGSLDFDSPRPPLPASHLESETVAVAGAAEAPLAL
ncbi:MAG: hypothetical protein M3442_02540, partial [Chloroflexota bacterium]|nr:hypothetical protein [Chloroflexota bacterium]